MKHSLLSMIRWYQRYLSPDTGIPAKIGLTRGRTCVFQPRCSDYTYTAIERYGTVRGLRLGVRRILRCHPWQKDHIDPVP